MSVFDNFYRSPGPSCGCGGSGIGTWQSSGYVQGYPIYGQSGYLHGGYYNPYGRRWQFIPGIGWVVI